MLITFNKNRCSLNAHKLFVGLQLTVVCCLFFFSCQDSHKKLRVAVASNLQYKIEKLKPQFEKKYNCQLDLIIASSGKLATQIQQNAPFDVFCAADSYYPTCLQTHFLPEQSIHVFTKGELILWSKQALDFSQGLNILTDTGISKIAIANPDYAPLGKASVTALKKAHLYPDIEHQLVFGESIAQVNQWIESGAVQIGLTEKSVFEAKGGFCYPLPPVLYPPIQQTVMVLKPSPMAAQFLAFLMEKKA